MKLPSFALMKVNSSCFAEKIGIEEVHNEKSVLQVRFFLQVLIKGSSYEAYFSEYWKIQTDCFDRSPPRNRVEPFPREIFACARYII